MSPCERIRDEAAGIAALRPDDPERAAAEAHASGCPGCARALEEGERLQALLFDTPALPEPVRGEPWQDAAPSAPAEATLGGAYEQIRGELRREARRRTAGSIAAITAAVLVLVAFARTRSPSSTDHALAAVLWATAVVLAAAASRRPGLVVGLSVVAVLAAGAIFGGPGPLVASVGLDCVFSELASAAAVVGAVWLALRGGTTSPARTAIAAAAAAGALAGDAALQVTCAAHGSMPHLLAFHVGGVLLAAAGAGLLWRRRPTRVVA